MQRAIAGFLVTAVALGLAACGGSTTASMTTSSHPSVRAQDVASHRAPGGFVAQANLICKEVKEQLAASLQEAASEVQRHTLSGPEALKRQTAEEKETREVGIRKLTALKPPHELQSAYSQYLGVQRKRLALIPANPPTASQLPHLVKESAAVDQRGNELARSMGFTSCS
jgi:hypothetical protein